jgi:predicted RNA methylase
LAPRTVERCASAVNGEVRAVWRGGRLRLDGPGVNYSFGTLHDVFAEAFESAGVYAAAPTDVLVLGLGAGSVVALLNGRRPPAKIVGVERDPVVLDLACRRFDLLRHANLEIVCDCAARHLRNDTSQYDLVVVDVFVGNLTPKICESEQFLAALAARTRRMALFNRMTETADNRRRNAEFGMRFARHFPKHERLTLPYNDVWVGRR